MHDTIEEAIKKAAESVFRDLKVAGVWQPATTTMKNRFVCDLVAVLCCSKGLDGIVAVSIPSGVAVEIARSSYQDAAGIDGKRTVYEIGRNIAYRAHLGGDTAISMNSVINGLDPKNPAPAPRRIIPFISNHGNLVLEIYLRKHSVFKQAGKDWWNTSSGKTGKPA